jgi:hypothetical protein
MMGGRPTFLPSPQQELLLKAALLDGPEAVESWNAWRAQVRVDDLDIGSQRLLPLLYRRLHALGVNHPDMERYKSVYRYVWVENQIRVRQAQIILDLLGRAEIPVLLLKGIALGPLYYGDLGLRPMNDLDFLVPPEHADGAGKALASAGWQAAELGLLASSAYRNANHAIACIKHSNPIEVDLHWHASRECCWDDADRGLWARAQDMQLGGAPARTLGDTDHLFHTCVHGTRWNEIAPIRWAADALTIMQGRTIDWSYFVENVQSGGYCRRFSQALSYLRENFAAPIPQAAISELANRPRRNVELLEAFLAGRRWPEFFMLLGQIFTYCWRHPSYGATPRGFLRYIMARWGTSSLGQTFAESLRRSARHVFRKA